MRKNTFPENLLYVWNTDFKRHSQIFLNLLDYPGFVVVAQSVVANKTVKSSIAAACGHDGRCLWIRLYHGRAKGYGELPHDKSEGFQREFVNQLRRSLLNGDDDELRDNLSLNVSPRTLEGWAQGRPIPFWRMAKFCEFVALCQ